MAAASLPAASPGALVAVRKFLSQYGLIVVLLIMPVAFGIHDLRTEGDLSRLGNNCTVRRSVRGPRGWPMRASVCERSMQSEPAP